MGTFSMWLVITCVVLLKCCDSFKDGPLVIWRESEVKIQAGLKTVVIEYTFENPCDEITLDSFSEQPYPKAKSDCEKEYNEKVLKRVAELCPRQDSSKILNRRKRFDPITWTVIIGFTATAAAVSSVGAVAGVGLKKAEDLEERMVIVEDYVKSVGDETKLNRDMVYNHTKNLNDLNRQVKQLQKHSFDAVNKLQSMMKITSILYGKFDYLDRTISKAQESWKKGKLNLEFFRAITPSSKIARTLSLENAEPLECFSTKKDVIKLIFKAPVLNRNWRILNADPFTLLTEANENTTCITKYIGPEHLIMSPNSTCVYEVKEKLSSTKKLMLLPPAEECLKREEIQEERLYKAADCQPTNETSWTKYADVKTMNGKDYIYCPRGNITIESATDSCPTLPFKIDEPVNYVVNGGQFVHEVDTYTIRYKLQIDWTTKANLFLKPGVDLEEYMVDLDTIRKVNFTQPPASHGGGGSSNQFIIYVGGVVAFCLLVMFAIIMKYAGARTNVNLNSNPVPTEMTHIGKGFDLAKLVSGAQ